MQNRAISWNTRNFHDQPRNYLEITLRNYVDKHVKLVKTDQMSLFYKRRISNCARTPYLQFRRVFSKGTMTGGSPKERLWKIKISEINPLNPELIPICYLLALLAHHFLHVNRIRVKSLTLRLLMSYIYIYIYILIYIYIYGAPILDVSRSHTTTQHSR